MEEAEKQIDALRSALAGLVDCISETRGKDATEALIVAKEVLREKGVAHEVPDHCPFCGSDKADGYVRGWYGWTCGSYRDTHLWQPPHFTQSGPCLTRVHEAKAEKMRSTLKMVALWAPPEHWDVRHVCLSALGMTEEELKAEDRSKTKVWSDK